MAQVVSSMAQVEIRVTRPSKYPHDTPHESREGYYFRAKDWYEAENKAYEKFPNERLEITRNKAWDENGKRYL